MAEDKDRDQIHFSLEPGFSRQIIANARILDFPDDTRFLQFSLFMASLFKVITDEKRRLFVINPDGAEDEIPLAVLVMQCGGSVPQPLNYSMKPSGDHLLASILDLDPDRKTDPLNVDLYEHAQSQQPVLFHASGKFAEAVIKNQEALNFPTVAAYVSFSLMMSNFITVLIANDQGLISKDRLGLDADSMNLPDYISAFGGNAKALTDRIAGRDINSSLRSILKNPGQDSSANNETLGL